MGWAFGRVFLWWYSKPNLSRIFSNQPGDSPTEPIKLHLLCQFGEALQWFLMAKGLGGFACLWLSAIVSQAWRCWIPEPSNVSKTEVKPSNCPFMVSTSFPTVGPQHCWLIYTYPHAPILSYIFLYWNMKHHETMDPFVPTSNPTQNHWNGPTVASSAGRLGQSVADLANLSSKSYNCCACPPAISHSYRKWSIYKWFTYA